MPSSQKKVAVRPDDAFERVESGVVVQRSDMYALAR